MIKIGQKIRYFFLLFSTLTAGLAPTQSQGMSSLINTTAIMENQETNSHLLMTGLAVGSASTFVFRRKIIKFLNKKLIAAARNNAPSLLQALLNMPGININHTEGENNTALIWAAYCGHTEIARRLLNTPDIDINHANIYSDTALIWAALLVRTEIVRLLLNTPGININHADIDGDTPLIGATIRGHTQIVQLLLNRPNININHAKNSGNTALTLAAHMGHTETVQLLLEAGADFTLQNNENMTAQDIANVNGHHATANLIRNYRRKRRILAEWALKNCENKRKLPREIRNEITEKYLGHPIMDPA